MHKYGLILASLLFIASCKEPVVKNKQLTSSEPHGKHLGTDQAIRTNQIKADTIVYSESLYINQQLFVVHQTNNDRIFVIKENRDTIFTRNDFSSDFEFKDFNGDGYKDIIIHYRTNVPGIEDLLLYAADEKTFKEVLDFQSFPAPEKIKGTDYYYSYHRSGCADMNWTSDLFYIKNYKAIKIGTIEGYECGNAGIKDGIYISKVAGDQELPVKQYPIHVISKYKSYKWGFIQEYWKKNWRSFP
jgi:hypothetical protein